MPAEASVDQWDMLRRGGQVSNALEVPSVETGAAQSDDPVTENMLRMARLLQDALVRTVGRDLTVHNPNILTWHTGNAVPLHTGDFRYRRPWEWIWRVMSGRSCGKHRSRHESSHAYSWRFLRERFFRF